jgi:hypothetical protein
MVWFFIQHKVYEIPGGRYLLVNCLSFDLTTMCLAYTRYSFFEWALILLDIFFDSFAAADFEESDLQVRFHLLPH